MQAKVSDLARRYGFSPDAVYAWVRSELIPPGCVIRVGNSIRIDSIEFDRLMRAGSLYRPRRRRSEEQARNAQDAASGVGFSEDQHMTRRTKNEYEHRFLGDNDRASSAHPYSPEMVDLTTSR